MNNIYRKEQEVSSKENNVNSNARNINSLCQCRKNTTIKATIEYTIHGPSRPRGSIFSQKYTSFSSKSKPKTHKKSKYKVWNRAYLAPCR